MFRTLSTRKLMTIVLLSAVACSGLRCGGQPGWWVAVPGGLAWRAGACRNDIAGRTLDRHGRPMGHQWQVGVWEGRGSGLVVFGVVVRDGRWTVVVGDRREILL